VNVTDLRAQTSRIQQRTVSAADLLETSLAAAAGPAARSAFVGLDAAGSRQAAAAADLACDQGRDAGALCGLAISVKDLFDIGGQRTRAGSTWLGAGQPAQADAVAVARLRQAGAALIGRTQMTEFAFSGVGINPHTGTPANAAMAAIGRADCVPGGSTSGGAVSVASGAAWAALGSDTGGSIRIPAALHGLVGYKNTQALTPQHGSVPLAPAMDTVCAITHSVRDAVLLHEVLAQRRVNLAGRALSNLRLGWIRNHFLDDLDAEVAQAFEASLSALAGAGARLRELGVSALAELPELTEQGGITAAQAWAWHAPHLAAHGHAYDPRVLGRIRRGAAISATRLAALHQHRQAWMARMEAALAEVDIVLSPTVPLIAPPLAPLLASDDEFHRVNALLLRNPAVVNLLDGCAITLPCHAAGTPPVGLMLWAPGGRDDLLLDAAGAVEAALHPQRSA
jgi:amidase/aspartyl-tRNA(Asn)/glutamyl-tRNA(Gln) amidotransferase subunit A